MTREEAIECIRGFMGQLTEGCREAIIIAIPELRESEDERKRKAALEGIEYLERNLGWDAIGDIDILDVKEYLEKQKEQKPEVDESTKRLNENWMKQYFDEQKPVEWSEEDKDMIAYVVAMCDDGLKDCVVGSMAYRVYNEIKYWINNLCPQYHWKPSDEQMEALKEASASWMNEKMGNAELLKSLYNELKKHA